MILNLNEFKKELNEIQIGDKIYKIPKDIPTIYFLELMEKSQSSDIKSFQECLKVLFDIFKIHNSELSYDEFKTFFTMDEYAAVLNFITAGLSIEETKKLLTEARESIKDSKKKPEEVI